MNCPNCDNLSKKVGKDRPGEQRLKCTKCDKCFTLREDKLLGSMILKEKKALLLLNLLVEGNSVRSSERITGVHQFYGINEGDLASALSVPVSEDVLIDKTEAERLADGLRKLMSAQ